MSQTYTIAIVEDNQWVRKLLEEYSEQSGLRIVFSGAEAEMLLKSVHDIQPDILLVDIGLQGELDGISMVQSLRKMGHRHKVIMVSGTSNIDHILTSFHDLGTLYFLSKPVLFSKFQSAINRAVAEIHNDHQASSTISIEPAPHWITVKHQKSEIPVSEESILYVEKEDKRQTMIHLMNGETIAASTNLTDILAQSTPFLFSPFKGFLINMRYVISYVKEFSFPTSRRFLIHMNHTSTKIPLSRNLQKEFARLLQELHPKS
ncbi:LytR/AlgR family response regulator transcription factor [Paenibacillus hexagrammi]|uniref:LytTR family DNA-binding domain-containing protein n=1 Tax=Paenibacillus hexagrammi TaxID=2908839 RepID=A0ABY3SMT4_9BACL|nr:LytTR family DNA-binding domain-containing protein [Paenibacillus sp. YPD9-1]UJF34396.1 LytTR family DNA-binding domain-containing protein [Paenibacillus sp. YPD9-1]